MIRVLLRTIVINLASVFISAYILSGVITYVGGIQTLLMASVIIALVNLFVRPVINLLMLPIHILTMGIFRWLANLVTLYIVTWLVPDLQIHPFRFGGLNLQYVIIPATDFSAFGAFVVATLTLTTVFHFMYWILQD